MRKVLPLLIAAIALLACGKDPAAPKKPDFVYLAKYRAVEANGYKVEDLGVHFTVEFFEDLRCHLFIQWKGQAAAETGCSYLKPDAAHDSQISLDEPYEKEVYNLHWDDSGRTLYFYVPPQTVWKFERLD